MSSAAFKLGQLAKQAAGPAQLVGSGVGYGVDVLAKLLGRGLKPIGGAYATQLAKNPLTTLGVTGSAAGAVGEGLSAARQGLSGLGIGSSAPTGDAWYAPHLSGARFNPHISGWGSLLNAYTKPTQFIKYLMGNNKLPEGAETAKGYNPVTQAIEGGSRAYSSTRDGKLQEVITHEQNKPLFDLFEKARKATSDLPQRGKRPDVAPVAPTITPKPVTPEAPLQATPKSPSRFLDIGVVDSKSRNSPTSFKA